MFGLTRTQLFIVALYKLTLCWHPAFGKFTHETCMELNATANITCTKEDHGTQIAFTNEDHLKINVSEFYNTFTISCFRIGESEFELSANVPRLQLGQLSFITIIGCFPFDAILQQLGIRIGERLALFRGETSTQLKRRHLVNLTGVTDFRLRGFDQLDVDVFADMEGIVILFLTQLEGPLPDRLLTPLSANLLQLNIHDYGMKFIPAGIFATLSRLERLNLSFNELKTIASGTFEKLYNLTDLRLNNNLLTQLPADLFHSLHKLDSLDISNNRLKKLELGTFAPISDLRHLMLENNALELNAATACSLFDGLTKLEYLSLSNNSLSVYCLPGFLMSSVRVMANNNKISELLIKAGESYSRKLVRLDLRNNRLQYLSADVLQYFDDSETSLFLADNPWHCDCESVPWLNFIKQNDQSVTDLWKLRCADGRSVRQVIQQTTSDTCKFKT